MPAVVLDQCPAGAFRSTGRVRPVAPRNDHIYRLPVCGILERSFRRLTLVVLEQAFPLVRLGKYCLGTIHTGGIESLVSISGPKAINSFGEVLVA